MTKSSRALLSSAAEILNRHVTAGTIVGKELAAGTEVSRSMVGVVNEILRESAEGGTLVCATEIDGKLLGFVPRADVVLPELPDLASRSGAKSSAAVPKGPDSSH
jgi:hypothetical protein